MASPDIGIPADAILQAAAEHDVLSLKHLLLSIPTTEPANVRDADGQAPLHVAIAACDPTLRLQDSQGAREPQDIDRSDATTSTPEDVGPAMATVQLLLDNGAIWNELDQNNETPGCIARRLGLNELYQIMVAAGKSNGQNKPSHVSVICYRVSDVRNRCEGGNASESLG